MPSHHHRAGSLKQVNKKNKRYKSSKRSASRAAGGKVAGRTQTATAHAAQNKANRRNHVQQRRHAKKQEFIKKKRGVSQQQLPPRVVGIVSLGASSDLEEQLRLAMLKDADQVVRPHEATVTCKYNVHKKDGTLTLLTTRAFRHNDGDDDAAAILAALDLARVCHVLVFIIDGNAPKPDETPFEIHMGEGGGNSTCSKTTTRQDFDHLISSRGDRILTAIKGQGLPTILTVLAHTQKEAEDHITMQSVKSTRRAGIKRHVELKKYVSRFALTEFGTGQDKVMEVDLTSDDDDEQVETMQVEENKEELESSSCAMLVRSVCQMSASGPKFVSEVPRSYLLSDSVQYDEVSKELKITGHIRGMAPLDANSLFHVPNLGTFGCKSVCRTLFPLRRIDKTVGTDDNESDVVQADTKRQEPLEMFATPNALEGEQNLVGFDQDADMDDDKSVEQDGFARPAGWSSYQAAWLDAVDDDGFDDAVDRGELAEALNQHTSSAMSVGGDVAMDLDDANDVNVADKRAIKEQRRKEMQDHLEFPDEVEVDEDIKASDRFARYRSLKSFRKSQWDPKENLPETYASIYHFSNFKATQRAVMNEMKDVIKAAEQAQGSFWGCSPGVSPDTAMLEGSDDEEDDFLLGCIPAGSYVTLTLRDVPVERIKSISPSALLCAVSLLPHENKVSVLHMGLCQTQSCDATEDNPVKSKDVLIFRCGWRTWKARPVFSQNNLNCDKHKYERYMPVQGAFFAASVFGPVTYTPCPVLVFREGEYGRRQLVAIGSMIGADADRIAVKRIVLTGYPVRVQKRWATVKYMFYNPDDVKWFKPAGLYTKHGLQGNIEESVGEHGTMKCLFNAPIKQHDTVCLPLYKRIYPKFAPEDGKDDDKTLSGKHTLLVV